MTRKHYIKIADAIKNNMYEECWECLIDDLCSIFKQDNANFNRDKFIDYIGRYDVDKIQW